VHREGLGQHGIAQPDEHEKAELELLHAQAADPPPGMPDGSGDCAVVPSGTDIDGNAVAAGFLAGEVESEDDDDNDDDADDGAHRRVAYVV